MQILYSMSEAQTHFVHQNLYLIFCPLQFGHDSFSRVPLSFVDNAPIITYDRSRFRGKLSSALAPVVDEGRVFDVARKLFKTMRCGSDRVYEES